MAKISKRWSGTKKGCRRAPSEPVELITTSAFRLDDGTGGAALTCQRSNNANEPETFTITLSVAEARRIGRDLLDRADWIEQGPPTVKSA